MRSMRLALGWILLSSAAFAADPASMEEMKKTVEELNAAMKAQQARIDQLEAKLNDGMQAEMAKVARELAEDASQQSALPRWLDNLELLGDLRLRYENFCYSGGDRTKPKDANRGRFRLRFGLRKYWLDKEWEVGFQLASGCDSDPRSTNQTFTDGFDKKPLWIDQAYARYEPKAVPGLTVMAGKMPNPLVTTALLWDSDINPEGAWAQYRHRFGDFEPFVNVGYWALEMDFPSPTGDAADPHTLRDAMLATYQTGFNWDVAKGVRWTSAATYYDYDHWDVAFSRAGGNPTLNDRLSSPNFHMVNVTNKVGWRAFNLPMAAYLDWVYNCGEDDPQRQFEDQNWGVMAGVRVGQNRKKGDWSVGYEYVHIAGDAAPGAFVDGEFEANSKGHIWSVRYNVTDWLSVGASLWWIEKIAGSQEDEAFLRSRLEAVWVF